MTDIFSTIRAEVDDFIYNPIEVVPSYLFDTYHTIKRAHLYVSGVFEDQGEYEGREKIFYNITRPRVETVTTYMDIDTKDIKLVEMNPSSHFATMFLDYEFKLKLKEMNTAADLNDMARQLTTYGTVVIEEDAEGYDMVDLRYLFLDPTVKSIKDSRFVTRKYFLDNIALREMKKEGWDADAIETIIAKKKNAKGKAADSYEDSGYQNQQRSSALVEVYKRYGYVEKGWLTGDYKKKDAKEVVFAVVVVAEPYWQSKDQSGAIHDEGRVLFKKEWKKELPYDDAHLFKVDGRWLGVGIPEALFPLQERVNELYNQQRVSMEIGMMHLFQTSDPSVLTNVLEQLKSGDVLQTRTPSAIQPINLQQQNLGAYNLELQNNIAQADRVSFANDILTGGDVPSSTPATNVVLQNNNAVKIHLHKRETFANLIKKVMLKYVLPKVIKDLNKEHLLKFVGNREELGRLDDQIATNLTEQATLENILAGNPVTEEQKTFMFETTVQELKKQGAARYVNLLSGYYSDHEYDLDINIDNEQEDVSVIANNTFAYMQFLATNPQALDDPVIREFAMSYGKKIGVPTGKLELALAERTGLQQPSRIPQAAGQTQPLETEQEAVVQ